MLRLKHFHPSEFKRCIPSCSIDDMVPEFLRLLDDCREVAGVPFVLNSAYRPYVYELEKGRSGRSYHCKGCAVDVRCTNSTIRAAIVRAALSVGLNGIGVAKNFVHLDNRSDFRIWLY